MSRFDARLLLVTDRHQTGGRPLRAVVKQALRGGVTAVQVRERDLSTIALLALARAVRSLAAPASCRLLINDRVDLALAMEHTGVHLRSDSLPVAAARRLLGSDRLIGASAHSGEEVLRAESEGADYVVFGPLYATLSKVSFGPPLGLRELEKICARVRVPVLGIGGITAERARDVRRAGAFGVAVIAAILSAPDVERAARELVDAAS
ncbi:MAG: thiamine phosphate synthase [Nitrospira sp.]|nr:thiamine phosphate synthase [Nitrospira sp.]